MSISRHWLPLSLTAVACFVSAMAFRPPSSLERMVPANEGVILLNAVTATGSSLTYEPVVNRQESGFVQVQVTGAATVTLDIKAHSGAPWYTCYTFTSTGFAFVPRTAQVRANVTAYTSGAVSVWFSK